MTNTASTLIRSDGSFEIIRPENGTNFQLEELYRLLGCNTVDLVRLGNGRILVIDDEGALNPNRIRNNRATSIYREAFGIRDAADIKARIADQEEAAKAAGVTVINLIPEGEELPVIYGDVLSCPAAAVL